MSALITICRVWVPISGNGQLYCRVSDTGSAALVPEPASTAVSAAPVATVADAAAATILLILVLVRTPILRCIGSDTKNHATAGKSAGEVIGNGCYRWVK
ncbi:hypothetical protein GCM10017786_68480 [Amycolatopsis deserti]|uniref:Uncharacterized protein n=1 Tax=Amycolatopsis deserti TaxID=185696 RepID=A0ABQ3JF91_9PSEU|nr:hypothetical protein GCM10017786_68480 [Amycolatopsis deserti]